MGRLVAQTPFVTLGTENRQSLTDGIRGVDLSEEERNQLIESGLDPDEDIDFEGSDLDIGRRSLAILREGS